MLGSLVPRGEPGVVLSTSEGRLLTPLLIRSELSSSAREDGSAASTRTAARALKPSKQNAADTDPSAQVSGTVFKASLLAQTR